MSNASASTSFAAGEVCDFFFRRHGDRRWRELQSGSETTFLPGQSLREEEQHPHHGRGHSLHRHGNGQYETNYKNILRQ